MIRVRVPATSANMGAGFDTLGIALGCIIISALKRRHRVCRLSIKMREDTSPMGKTT